VAELNLIPSWPVGAGDPVYLDDDGNPFVRKRVGFDEYREFYGFDPGELRIGRPRVVEGLLYTIDIPCEYVPRGRRPTPPLEADEALAVESAPRSGAPA